MTNEQFFIESMEQSRVKAAIASRFFWSWAKLVAPRVRGRGDRIAYIDLFAGPGRYADGSLSTPLLVLNTAIENPEFHDILFAIFNDRCSEFTSQLAADIKALPDIEKLAHQPQIYCSEIGSTIVEQFENMKLVPTLMFIDPWGYKGLSLRLIQSVLKDWGCDCMFFFNYNRINMGLSNPLVQEHMEALFGAKRAAVLSDAIKDLSPEQRELSIVEELCNAHKEFGAEFVLPFRFRNEKGTRTSHHLVFASKNFTAYHIMKDIMAKESSSDAEGVPSFEYSPADARYPRLFSLNSPLASLAPDLLDRFSGRQLLVKQIYREHSVDKPFVTKNYKDVLLSLEIEGRISVLPNQEDRRPGTMGDNVRITFPE